MPADSSVPPQQLAPTASSRPTRMLAALTLALALLSGRAHAAPLEEPVPTPTPPPPPTRYGEAYTFTLKFFGVLEGGRARLAIAPPHKIGNDVQLNVIGEAEATGLAKAITGLHEDYRLVLDGATLLPRRLDLTETGLRSRTVTVNMSGRRIDIFARKSDAQRHLAGVLPSEPLEPVAVLLLLRAARLKQGDRLNLVVMDGTAFYQGSISVMAREEVVTAMGTRPAIRLLCRGERVSENGVRLGRPPREATMWVSDDHYRVPLRVEAETDLGKAEFELTSFEAPRRPIPLPKQLVGITEQLAP